MILFTKDFIKKIKNSKNKIKIVCGASERARYLIEKYGLFDEIDYVLDNYSNKEHFLNIPIIKFKDLKENDNKLFIICGAHQKTFYEQINKLLNSDYIFEYNKKALPLLFNKNFTFEVEIPNFQSGFGIENRNIFAKNLINELLFFNQKIITTPIKPENEEFLRKRVTKENSLLFSYHGIGDRDIRKIYYKEGYFFDLINIDDMGYSGWSSLCQDKNELEQIKRVDIKKAQKDFLQYKKRYIDKNLSKYIQPEIKDIELPKNFVFIPLQIFTESVMEKSYFEPMFWFKNVVKILSEKNINIVIKRHPRCTIKEVELELESIKNQKNITIYNGSINKAINECMAIYTINSGVGFESLFHLKPVVTFGEVDYQSATFNIKDFKDLENNLIPVLSEEKIEYIKQFLSYYMRKKNININSKKNIEKFLDSFVLSYLNNLLKEDLE